MLLDKLKIMWLTNDNTYVYRNFKYTLNLTNERKGSHRVAQSLKDSMDAFLILAINID